MIFHSKNSKHAMPTDFLVLKGPLHEVVSVSRVHHVAFRPYLVKIMFVLREEQRIFVTLHYYVRWLKHFTVSPPIIL